MPRPVTRLRETPARTGPRSRAALKGDKMTDAVPAMPPPTPSRWGPVGKIRNPWAVIGLSIITCGIYYLYWTYCVFQETKDHSGEGVGGVIGLVIGLVIGVVNLFLLPAEIGNMYAKAGQPKPITGLAGFWNLIPLIGTIIWFIKVQGALNERWLIAGTA